MEEVLLHMAHYLEEHPEKKPPPPLKKLFYKVITFVSKLFAKDEKNKIEMAVAHIKKWQYFRNKLSQNFI